MVVTFCFYQIEILSTHLLGHLEFQMCTYYPCFCAKITTRMFWNDPFAHLISRTGTGTFRHISWWMWVVGFFYALVCKV